MVIVPHEFTDHTFSLSRNLVSEMSFFCFFFFFFLIDSTNLYFSNDYNFLNFFLPSGISVVPLTYLHVLTIQRQQ